MTKLTYSGEGDDAIVDGGEGNGDDYGDDVAYLWW